MDVIQDGGLSRLTLEQQQDDSALHGFPWRLRQWESAQRRRETRVQSRSEAPPEEGVATHPRVFAGKPWAGNLLGMIPGIRRVRPDTGARCSAVRALVVLVSLSDLRPKFIRDV